MIVPQPGHLIFFPALSSPTLYFFSQFEQLTIKLKEIHSEEVCLSGRNASFCDYAIRSP